jgi:hypothetical protein
VLKLGLSFDCTQLDFRTKKQKYNKLSPRTSEHQINPLGKLYINHPKFQEMSNSGGDTPVLCFWVDNTGQRGTDREGTSFSLATRSLLREMQKDQDLIVQEVKVPKITFSEVFGIQKDVFKIPTPEPLRSRYSIWNKCPLEAKLPKKTEFGEPCERRVVYCIWDV